MGKLYKLIKVGLPSTL